MAVSVSTASTLRNPYNPFPAALTFDWDIRSSTGSTGWLEADMIETSDEYVELNDESCGCPDGFTPPCYQTPVGESMEWSLY